MKFSTGVLFWDLNFVRAIQDWELESLSNFLDSIYGVSLKGVGMIRIIGILIKFCSSLILLDFDKKYRSILPMEDCLEAQGPF